MERLNESLNSVDTIRMPVTELVTRPSRQKNLDDYAREFLASYDNENTRKSYAGDLRLFLNFTKGEISDESLLIYRKSLVDGSKPRSANRRLTVLVGFLDSLVAKGVLDRNPLGHIKRLRVRINKNDSVAEPLTDAEVGAIISTPDTSTLLGRSQRLAFILGFFLGLRVSEVTHIRIGDISEGKLKVLGKGNKWRTLHLEGAILEELENYVSRAPFRGYGDPEDFLLVNDRTQGKRPIDTDTVGLWWKGAADSCGITKRVTSHTGRATAITKLLDSEVPFRDVMNFAGHSNPETTLIYDKKKREAPERVVSRIRYEMGNK